MYRRITLHVQVASIKILTVKSIYVFTIKKKFYHASASSSYMGLCSVYQYVKDVLRQNTLLIKVSLVFDYFA